MRPTPPPLSNLATSGDHRAWMALSLPTLTVVLGLQMLRTLLPLFIFVLRDRIGWEAYQVGLLAFAIFASGFLVGAIYRLLGSKRVLLLTAGGLGVARLAIQLWRGDPLGDLSFAIAGTILFILFLPTYLGHVRAQGPDATSHYGLAVLLGISLDTALFGAFGTYDMVWRDGGTALAVTLVLVALLLASLLTLPPSEGSRSEPQADDSRWQVLPWVAVGSLLFLQLMVFQNVARLTALADWEMPLAFVWVMLSNTAGLGAAVWMLAYWRQNRWPIAALIGAILVVTLSFNERNAAVAAITLMAGQVSPRCWSPSFFPDSAWATAPRRWGAPQPPRGEHGHNDGSAVRLFSLLRPKGPLRQ